MDGLTPTSVPPVKLLSGRELTAKLFTYTFCNLELECDPAYSQ